MRLVRHCSLIVILGLFSSCSENLSFEMNKAAENGDNARIQELLSKGANINGTDNCMTPLMRAILTGHVETVKLLLIRGAMHAPALRPFTTPTKSSRLRFCECYSGPMR